MGLFRRHFVLFAFLLAGVTLIMASGCANTRPEEMPYDSSQYVRSEWPFTPDFPVVTNQYPKPPKATPGPAAEYPKPPKAPPVITAEYPRPSNAPPVITAEPPAPPEAPEISSAEYPKPPKAPPVITAENPRSSNAPPVITAEPPAPPEAPAVSTSTPSDEKEPPIISEDEEPGDLPVADQTDYRLRPGDQLDITVYREAELSGSFRVDPSGQIRHPLLGAVELAGLTQKEAEARLTKILADDFLVNPRVMVKITAAQSSQVVIFGEVKKPGVYPIPFGETLTLLQAIAGAGGFTELASLDRVRIVRTNADGKQETIRVRVSGLLSGKSGERDIPLEPNDVITVPQVVF